MSVSQTPYDLWVDKVAASLGRMLTVGSGTPLTAHQVALCRSLAEECVNNDPAQWGSLPCRHCGELTTPAGHLRNAYGICDPAFDPRITPPSVYGGAA